MHGSEKGQKFQPRISKRNSFRLIDLPESIRPLAQYRSVNEIKAVSQIDGFEIFYILTDDSTLNKLIPLRDNQRNFCTIICSAKL